MTWTQDGHIMIKITDSSDPVPIETHSDLRNLLYGDGEQLSEYSDIDYEHDKYHEDTDLDTK